jgi:hypothetical protein
MARYVFVVRALSPRDGGWVRIGGHCPSERLALEFIELFWGLLVDHGDFVAVEIVRTIAF